MNDAVRLLASLPDIEHLVVVGGGELNDSVISDVIREIGLKDISFYIQRKDANIFIEEIINEEIESGSNLNSSKYAICDFNKIFTLESLPEKTALFFEGLSDPSILYQLTILHPYFLCGTLQRGTIGAYEVWEKYRVCSEKIYLITCGGGIKNETLFWKRQGDSDIELSVIFPVYNVAKYLEQCIATATAWQADYIEFLFVDDGSSDNSADIIKSAAKQDSRIKLLQKENGGCASARQYGMERARGRYVGFIDPDDYIDKSMFHKLLRRAMTGSYEIAYCGYSEEYTETGEKKQIPDILWEPYFSGTTDLGAILQLCAFSRIAIWRRIYSLEMIKKAKLHFYTDLRRFDDLPFKFETFAVAKSVVSIPEHLYYYRLGRPGQDVSANDERLYAHFQIFQYLDKFVTERGINKTVEMLQLVKLQTHSWAIQIIKPEYLPAYLNQAHKDLITLFTPKESEIIFKHYASKKDRKIFRAIIEENEYKAKKLVE